MGACSELMAPRFSRKAESFQVYSRSQTTEAVRGGFSANSPTGSAFSVSCPCLLEWIWNLYNVPLSTPGIKPSQIPDEPRACSGWDCGFQPLKPPITDTRRALGAQTLKTAPLVPLDSTRCAPIFSRSEEHTSELQSQSNLVCRLL